MTDDIYNSKEECIDNMEGFIRHFYDLSDSDSVLVGYISDCGSMYFVDYCIEGDRDKTLFSKEDYWNFITTCDDE